DPGDQSGLSGPTGQSSPGPGDGRPSYGQPGPSSSPASGPSRRPTYGKPAPSQAPATPTQQPPAGRPSFGQPDHSADTNPSEQRDGAPGTGFDKPAPSQAPTTPTQQPPADRPSFGQPDHSEDTSPSEQRDGTPGSGYGRLSAEYGQSGRVYGYSGPEYGQPGQQQGDHTDDGQTAQDAPDDPRCGAAPTRRHRPRVRAESQPDGALRRRPIRTHPLARSPGPRLTGPGRRPRPSGTLCPCPAGGPSADPPPPGGALSPQATRRPDPLSPG